MMVTLDDKILVVERLIEAFRQTARPGPDDLRLSALKSIASDLRARREGEPTIALVELDRRMSAVRRYSDPASRVNAKVGVAEELICRWPVVSQALEKFGAELEQDK